MHKDQDSTETADDHGNKPRQWLGAANLLSALGYVALVVAVVWAMNRTRDWAVATLSNEAAQANWDEFRHDAKEFSRNGPVKRRVPPSSEPPTLRLLRDHFPASLAAALFFSSAVYWSAALLLRGSILSGKADVAKFASEERY